MVLFFRALKQQILQRWTDKINYYWCDTVYNTGQLHLLAAALSFLQISLNFLLTINFVIIRILLFFYSWGVKGSKRVGFYWTTLRLCNDDNRWMNVSGALGNNNERGKVKHSGKDLWQCHFVHHKFRILWEGQIICRTVLFWTSGLSLYDRQRT